MAINIDFKNKHILKQILGEGIEEGGYKYKSKEKRAEVPFPVVK